MKSKKTWSIGVGESNGEGTPERSEEYRSLGWTGRRRCCGAGPEGRPLREKDRENGRAGWKEVDLRRSVHVGKGGLEEGKWIGDFPEFSRMIRRSGVISRI